MEAKDQVLQIFLKENKYILLDSSTRLFWVLEPTKIIQELASKKLSFRSLIELLAKNDDLYSKDLYQKLIKLRKFHFFSYTENNIQTPPSTTQTDINHIYINPSSDCNLDCWFCYADNLRKRKLPRLDIENILKLIQSVLDYKERINSTTALGVSIGFTEELNLNFTIFLEVSKFIEKMKINYNHPIFLFIPSSNLLDVSDEFIEFTNNYKFLTVSVDIDNEIQISQVIKNLGEFNSDVKKHLIIPFHSRTTNLVKLYSRFSEHFNLISLRPVRVSIDSKHPWSQENFENFKEVISRFYHDLQMLNDENLLSIFSLLGPVDYFYRYFKRIIERQKLSERCTAGKTAFAINSLLEVSPCSSLFSCEKLNVKIHDFQVEKALQSLTKRLPNYKETECSTCYISSFCGGPCMDWLVKQENQRISNPSKIECDFNKYIVEESLSFITNLSVNRQAVFEKIVKKRELRNRLNYPLSFNSFSEFFS